MQALSDFVKLYFNAENTVTGALCVICALIICNIILYILSFLPLKRLIRILRSESGENIILKINSVYLTKRYRRMWDDYYDAYHNENTVTLSNYLIKSDINIFYEPFKRLCRVTAVLASAAVFYASAKLNADIIYPLSILVIALTFAEFINRIITTSKKKKLLRLLEEFNTLSLRKLPGKAIDFSSMYILRKTDKISEQLKTMQNSLTQVNARLDRQYETIIDSPEEN